jgi:uncharacterized membrane protein
MAWWKKAIIGSVAWTALIFIIIMVHTTLTRDEPTTPEQDYAISRRYGQVYGAVLGAVWALSFFTARKRGR